MLQKLTAIKQVVFCDACGQFVGMASPGAIVDGLAWAFPVLDELARKLRQEIASFDIDLEITRQTAAWNNSLNPHTTSPPAQTEKTLKVGVRGPLLELWLGERWVSRCIRVDSHDLSMSQVQQLVDSLLPDAPIQRRKKDGANEFELLVVDRDAFALELAREWVRSGLPRSPVR